MNTGTDYNEFCPIRNWHTFLQVTQVIAMAAPNSASMIYAGGLRIFPRNATLFGPVGQFTDPVVAPLTLYRAR